MIRLHSLVCRRLRAAGVAEESRKALLDPMNGSITSRYSAADLGKIVDEANKISATDSRGPGADETEEEGRMKNVPQRKRPMLSQPAFFVDLFGRDGVIRTLDPLHPIKVN